MIFKRGTGLGGYIPLDLGRVVFHIFFLRIIVSMLTRDVGLSFSYPACVWLWYRGDATLNELRSVPPPPFSGRDCIEFMYIFLILKLFGPEIFCFGKIQTANLISFLVMVMLPLSSCVTFAVVVFLN